MSYQYNNFGYALKAWARKAKILWYFEWSDLSISFSVLIYITDKLIFSIRATPNQLRDSSQKRIATSVYLKFVKPIKNLLMMQLHVLFLQSCWAIFTALYKHAKQLESKTPTS